MRENMATKTNLCVTPQLPQVPTSQHILITHFCWERDREGLNAHLAKPRERRVTLIPHSRKEKNLHIIPTHTVENPP